MRPTFLTSEADDAALEASNEPFWDALINRIRADGFDRVPRTVVDIGAHRGGLLERVTRTWGASSLYAIEPVPQLRKRVLLRLRGQADSVQVLSPDEWGVIPSGTVDLVLAMESLHLVDSLSDVFGCIARVLAERGRAYLVLGCHAENPVWPAWKRELEGMGHAAFTHKPLDIMSAGAREGLLPSVCPLRREGWVTHDPREPMFTFEGVGQMLDHHFRHKLLFRFIRG